METGFNLTIAEAAAKAGVSTTTIRNWINKKGLESMEHTPEWGVKTTLVSESDVMEMLKRRDSARG